MRISGWSSDVCSSDLLPVQPAGAIDAAELRIFLVAAPIGARHARQLEGGGIELAGRGEVRPAAHVHPGCRIVGVAGPIDADLFACGQLCRPFGLAALAVLFPPPATGRAVPPPAPPSSGTPR